VIFLSVAILALAAAILYHGLTRPPFPKDKLMQIADLVTGLEAVTAQLTPLPAEITAAIAAGDATALATIDAPFAALQSAVAAVAAALPTPPAA
jgi:hypothetical protein